MRIYDESDYKEAIKNRIKELKKVRPGFSLRKLAEMVPMQYTFLSRILSQEGLQLSEDQLFSISEALDFYPDETEFLFLLRAVSTTANERRRQILAKRIEEERSRHSTSAAFQNPERSEFNLGITYLSDPTQMFVHLALQIPKYFRKPELVSEMLGITLQRLQTILIDLDKLGYIELGKSALEVKKVNNAHIHFGAEHPLIRMHQLMIRSLAVAQLLRLPETEKKSLQIHFTADERASADIRSEFDQFIRKVEKIAVPAQSKAIYHLSFDFFRWFR